MLVGWALVGLPVGWALVGSEDTGAGRLVSGVAFGLASAAGLDTGLALSAQGSSEAAAPAL